MLFVEVMGEEQATTREVVAASGAVYQIETQVFWDGKPERDIRAMVSVDDGGISAFKPLTDDFIVAPDGSFVGE